MEAKGGEEFDKFNKAEDNISRLIHELNSQEDKGDNDLLNDLIEEAKKVLRIEHKCTINYPDDKESFSKGAQVGIHQTQLKEDPGVEDKDKDKDKDKVESIIKQLEEH